MLKRLSCYRNNCKHSLSSPTTGENHTGLEYGNENKVYFISFWYQSIISTTFIDSTKGWCKLIIANL